MNNLTIALKLTLFAFLPFAMSPAFGAAKVMNPGEAFGQLVFLSEADVKEESPKFKSLSVISIPVFAELPMNLSVVAGAITLKQQNLLSHVQIKSRARKTPNLDISGLEGGLDSELMRPFKDGDFVHLLLGRDGSILLEPSSKEAALDFQERKKTPPVEIRADLRTRGIFRSSDLGWRDFDKVGSKAANYAELARVLNTAERTVVRPSFALPFYYYQEFIEQNPEIGEAISRILRDPLMNKIDRVAYRESKLQALRDMILSEESKISESLVNDLLFVMDGVTDYSGRKRKMKFRSSTNAEDLPDFNGAGLYTSESYKPEKDGKEKSRAKKEKSLREALRTVWASIWNLRAYDEREFFGIPHDQVKMGIQINPSFPDEEVDGVVVTKNVAGRPELSGKGVYIEAQRGDKHSVANPLPGVKPEQILVLVDEMRPLDWTRYRIHLLQRSNIADDKETILGEDNPVPVMRREEIVDLVYQSLKAELHFARILGGSRAPFALDLEFKVDSADTGKRQTYLKQARPYLD